MDALTTRDIQLVRNTWKQFRDVSPLVVGDAFYSKLFADNRSLRKIFPSDMDTQYRKLVEMLNSIVSHLDDLSAISPELRSLAVRHAQWGVKPAHYKPVGAALLWTLQQGLGRDWNSEVQAAWQKCYSQLAATIIQEAERYNMIR